MPTFGPGTVGGMRLAGGFGGGSGGGALKAFYVKSMLTAPNDLVINSIWHPVAASAGSPANIHPAGVGGLDIVVTGVTAGDRLRASLHLSWSNVNATDIQFDIATIIGGAFANAEGGETHWFSTGTAATPTLGKSPFFGPNINNFNVMNASAVLTVVAGDLAAGSVRCRPYGWCPGGGTKVLWTGSGTTAPYWSIEHLAAA